MARLAVGRDERRLALRPGAAGLRLACLLLEPDEHGQAGDHVPAALDGQNRDDAGEPAQVARGLALLRQQGDEHL